MSRSASWLLRQVAVEERQELQRVSRATSEPRIRHQRAVARLSISEGKSLSEAARLVGWKGHDPVTKVTRRFNIMGLSALDDLPRSGPHRTYGPDVAGTDSGRSAAGSRSQGKRDGNLVMKPVTPRAALGS